MTFIDFHRLLLLFTFSFGEEQQEEEDENGEEEHNGRCSSQADHLSDESYDGDKSESESSTSPTPPGAVGRDWYQHHSSSEPEWPMTLPVAMALSDWSDSFTQSDLRSVSSNSSWETEEEEVIIGGSSHDLDADEEHQPHESWEETTAGTTAGTAASTTREATSTTAGVTSTTVGTTSITIGTTSTASGTTPGTTGSDTGVGVLPLTVRVSLTQLNAYDAHIRLDQNGTTSDGSSWETAHEATMTDRSRTTSTHTSTSRNTAAHNTGSR